MRFIFLLIPLTLATMSNLIIRNSPIALRKFIEAITCTLEVAFFFSKGITSLIRQKMILYHVQLINIL